MLTLVDTPLHRFATEASPPVQAVCLFLIGLALGPLLARCINRLPYCEPILRRGSPEAIPVTRWRALVTGAITGLLFAALGVGVFCAGLQDVVDVGDPRYVQWRVLSQLVLVAFLVVATGTDLDLYVIPDSITLTGTLLGLAFATGVGQLHLAPLWVDWNVPLVHIHGQYIPEWIRNHPHWHGLAWSLAGAFVGGAVTWTARGIANRVLGMEAMGFGDVTLMAMIGSFLGWQAMVFVFPFGALIGLAVVLVMRVSSGRTAVPYGPYLSAAAYAVLMSWKWLWLPTRAIFGHWPTMLTLAGISGGTLALLLGLLRLYRAIPATARRRQ